MPYETAKCPNCGGELQLDNNMEAGYCSYCGSKLIVREAIQKLKEKTGKKSSIENELLRGRQCLEAHDWDTARLVFSSAIDKEADNFEAWMGYLTAATLNFNYVDPGRIAIGGVKGLESTIQNCLYYASSEKEQEIIQNIKAMLSAMRGTVEKLNNERLKPYYRKYRPRYIVSITILVLLIMSFIYSFFGDRLFLSFLSLLMTVIFSVIVWRNKQFANREDYLDKNALEYIDWIGRYITINKW